MNSEQILRQFEDALKITEWDREAKKILKKPLGIICCDTETSGLLFHTPSYFKDEERWVDNPFPFGISLAFNYNGRIVLVWGRYGSKLYEECKRILQLPNIKIWHNMKYDLRVCKTNGIEVKGPQHCTLTMSRIYWDRRKNHRLQALSEFICPQISAWEEELKEIKKREKAKWTRLVKKEKIWLPEGMDAKEYWNYSFLPDEVIGSYSMCDVFVDYIIYKKIAHKISSEFRDLYVRERKVIEVVTKIEETGLRWDVERAKKEIALNQPKIDAAEKKVIREAEKYYKPVRERAIKQYEEIKAKHVLKHYPDQKLIKQLRKDKKLKWAFGTQKTLDLLLKLGIKKEQLKDRGRITTEEDVLARCLKEGVPKKAEQFIKALMDYRAYAKITNTYLKPLTLQAERNEGIVYTTINPTSTRTGRPASRDPNLLNVPRPTVKKKEESNPVRACFIPREECVIYYFDEAQQELAMLFVMCGADDLLEKYMSGEDMHLYMATQLGKPEKRDIIKYNTFGKIYGKGLKLMSLDQGISMQQAKKEMQIYDEAFPFVKDLEKRYQYELETKKYVEDFFGRRYHIPVNQAYKAINAVDQGGCAQVFKIGLINVSRYLIKSGYGNILLLPYDEIQIETKRLGRQQEAAFCNDVIDKMVNIPQLLDRGLRLRVDVKKTETNWSEKQKVEL